MNVHPRGGPWLVTGASGLAGWHVLDALVARGLGAEGTCHRRAVRHPRAAIHRADLADPATLEALLDAIRPAGVVHCAALADPSRCESDPVAARAINLEVTERLARWCGAHHARMLFVSSDLVFDGTKPGGRYVESDPVCPSSRYGALKVRAEEAIRHLTDDHAIVRSALLLGRSPCGARSLTERTAAALRAGTPLTLFTDEYRTPLHAGDLARALADLATGGHRGTFHLGGPERLTRHEIGLRIARGVGADPSLCIARTQAEVPTVPPRAPDVSLCSDRLLSLLGWTPRGLEEGLAQEIAP